LAALMCGLNREAAGFLGMSEKALRDLYGHHHPDHLQQAAFAIGTKKPVSLVIPLVRRERVPDNKPHPIEKIGGPGRTRTCNQTVMSGGLTCSGLDFQGLLPRLPPSNDVL
jgi:hypothetical protein